MQNALNVMVLQLLNEVSYRFIINHQFLIILSPPFPLFFFSVNSTLINHFRCFNHSFNFNSRQAFPLLYQQVRKTCFDKCFGPKFSDSMSKNEQICLAKCMDRMYEAHAVVMKASTEIAQNLASSAGDSGMGGGL